MVQVLAARARENAGGVVLEAGLVGLDGNGDWVDRQSLFEASLTANIDVTLDRDNGLAGRSLALAIAGSVRVGAFLAQAVGLDVIKAEVHQPAPTTVVAKTGGTIDELLLGVRSQLGGGNRGGALNGTGGGESPAGTALALVLDGGHRVLGTPVQRSSGLDVGEDLRGALSAVHFRSGNVAVGQSGKLCGGEVRVLVDRHGVGVVASVVLIDHAKVFGEDVEAMKEFVRLIGLLELLGEGRELALELGVSQSDAHEGN
mmetsp:Transcript_11640/g.13173  ORF Transcript_11640/g.13173 Transcript_11640/m.13173 type:complete len:258 (-) Transcript_11640:11-784(-)